jgi:methylated-DNA-[protein]-cysteine S-methyltransferase
MKTLNLSIIDSPIGKLSIETSNNQITHIHFCHQNTKTLKSKDSFNQSVLKALESFFKKSNNTFDFPLHTKGTEFQQRVWKALQKIPRGEVRTYQDLANQLKTSPRAVGNACRANPIPVIIPCHRVVAKNGIGGFSGKTSGSKISIKEWLLNHERQQT